MQDQENLNNFDSISESKNSFGTSRRNSNMSYNLPELKIKKYKIVKWTKEEDLKLISLAENVKSKSWKKIASNFENKTSVQCFYRWNKVIKPNTINDEWTTEEDNFIIHWVAKYGILNWTNCAKYLRKKTPKNCKNRWNNVLSKDYKGEVIWNPTDELFLLLCVKYYKTSWSKIKQLFINKTENNLKNRFYSILRRAATIKLSEIKGYENFNIFSLKPIQLIQFLQDAIDNIKVNLGEEIFEELNSRFSKAEKLNIKENVIIINQDNSSCSSISNIFETCSYEYSELSTCKTNICSSCLYRLRIEVKRRLATNTIKYYADREEIKSNELFKDIDVLKSTKDKITAIKGLLQNVSR